MKDELFGALLKATTSSGGFSATMPVPCPLHHHVQATSCWEEIAAGLTDIVPMFSNCDDTVKGMKYPVALISTEEGYSISCPGLSGCWSQGATEQEALANIQDAIREYLEAAKVLAGEQNLREVEIPA